MSTQQKLNGKIAVVTGASKGIGASISKALAAAGATVVVNYSSSKTGADQVVDSIHKNGGKAVAIQANVARKADIDRLFAEVKKEFGRIDILVNNAGIYEMQPLEGITEEHFHKQFDINVLGLLLGTQQALPLFGPEGGSVINISSIVSSRAFPGAAVYSATKGAVDAITRVLSAELGSRHIRVNAINPGMIETEGTHTAGIIGSDFEKEIASKTPLGRIGRPDDIASVAVFLAAADSGWVTGETLTVAGGNR